MRQFLVITTRAGRASGGGGGTAGSWAGRRAGTGTAPPGWLGLGVVSKCVGTAPPELTTRACQSFWMPSTQLTKSRTTAPSIHSKARTCRYHGQPPILASAASVAYAARAEGDEPTEATSDADDMISQISLDCHFSVCGTAEKLDGFRSAKCTAHDSSNGKQSLFTRTLNTFGEPDRPQSEL